MKFLIIDTYYAAFLRFLYSEKPELTRLPYADHWRALMDHCFGTADFYSTNLRQLGHDATEIVANCEPLQRQWAKEHAIRFGEARWTLSLRKGFVPWPQRVATESFYEILLGQVKYIRPDVLHILDMNTISPAFLREIRPFVRLVVGQIASPIALNADFRAYDLVLSSLPHYVQKFREQGLGSELLRLGFEPYILTKLTVLNEPYEVVHVGGYGPVHLERNQLLEALAMRGIPLRCWGYGIEQVPIGSPLHDCYSGEAWGLGMYNVRHNSRVVVSKHISSVANVYANIMTLYETTGVGSLLVIDERQDLRKLFEPGREVVAYRSTEECAELISYYLEHEDEREAIAHAGQERTLREHTYLHRMQEFVEIVKSCLAPSTTYA